MSLPKIDAPTYELTLPSSDRKVKYRPFLVKEEKLLIIAMESEDMNQIQTAVKQVLSNCILTRGIKVEKLSTFDIEYLFLNIRGKSVGETVDVILTCPDDGETRVDVTIPLSDIQVQKDPKHTNIIQLDEQFSMKMRYPSLSEFVQDNFVDSGIEQ
jgi:citrate lyase gamma subunit